MGIKTERYIEFVVFLVQCDKHCDYCKEPIATKKTVQQMKQLHVPKHSHMPGTSFAYYQEGVPDPMLYGGGRWGRAKCVNI